MHHNHYLQLITERLVTRDTLSPHNEADRVLINGAKIKIAGPLITIIPDCEYHTTWHVNIAILCTIV